MAFDVAIYVRGVVIIFGFFSGLFVKYFIALKAVISADVPEFTKTVSFTPM